MVVKDAEDGMCDGMRVWDSRVCCGSLARDNRTGGVQIMNKECLRCNI